MMIKITSKQCEELSVIAAHHNRKRTIHNFHEGASDLLQRMINAMEPETYVQPHKHDNPDKREVFIALSGEALVVEFADDGEISDHAIIKPLSACMAVEIPPKIYHAIYALKRGTILYEVKDGPYDVATDKVFASWAPAENSKDSEMYKKELFKKLGIV